MLNVIKNLWLALIPLFTCITTFGCTVTITRVSGEQFEIRIPDRGWSVSNIAAKYAEHRGVHPLAVALVSETSVLPPNHVVKPGTCLQAVIDGLANSLGPTIDTLEKQILDSIVYDPELRYRVYIVLPVERGAQVELVLNTYFPPEDGDRLAQENLRMPIPALDGIVYSESIRDKIDHWIWSLSTHEALYRKLDSTFSAEFNLPKVDLLLKLEAVIKQIMEIMRLIGSCREE